MRTLLPRRNAERRGKTAFNALMNRGLLGNERETFGRILRRGRAFDAGYVEPGWVERRWDSIDTEPEAMFNLWKVCALELWLGAKDTGEGDTLSAVGRLG